MPAISPLTWTVAIAALVVGILAGHFGWGRRWLKGRSRVHPDYLAGLDYLVMEQPDRALDVFLRLMDADAETLETHLSLGALYRRRGEVERAIRIHQNLLARESLAPEHREQALLALAHDYLRAGLLDRAEVLLQQVSEVPRLRASALESLRSVYEQQHDWQQALSVHRALTAMKAAPPKTVAAHYLCELAAAALERGDTGEARRLLDDATREAANFPRAALLGSRIAELNHDRAAALELLYAALEQAPQLLPEELPQLRKLAAPGERDVVLAKLESKAEARGPDELKRLVLAAVSAGLSDSAPLSAAIEAVFAHDPALEAVRRAVAPADDGTNTASLDDALRVAREIGALLATAEKYRCAECGFAGRNFYWHCPACHAWDSFETYTTIKLG